MAAIAGAAECGTHACVRHPRCLKITLACGCWECVGAVAAAAAAQQQPTAAGLVRCESCGGLAAPRGDRLSLHFASVRAMRPCAGSWPERKASSR